MQSYKYKAVNSNGMIIRGVQYASSISSLRDQLMSLNLSPISIDKNYSISNLLDFFGKKHSEDTLEKLRVPKSKYVCSHCSKVVGGESNFKRWHGDNCKSIKELVCHD